MITSPIKQQLIKGCFHCASMGSICWMLMARQKILRCALDSHHRAVQFNWIVHSVLCLSDRRVTRAKCFPFHIAVSEEKHKMRITQMIAICYENMYVWTKYNIIHSLNRTNKFLNLPIQKKNEPTDEQTDEKTKQGNKKNISLWIYMWFHLSIHISTTYYKHLPSSWKWSERNCTFIVKLSSHSRHWDRAELEQNYHDRPSTLPFLQHRT